MKSGKISWSFTFNHKLINANNCQKKRYLKSEHVKKVSDQGVDRSHFLSGILKRWENCQIITRKNSCIIRFFNYI